MHALTTPEALEACLAASHQAPVFILKHSTACPISHSAHRRFADFLASDDALPAAYIVKVIEDRPISNAIAGQLGVRHASPQLLLVKDGTAVWDTSHTSIEAATIQEALAEHLP
jgi:bacillithiol system protein YtxJ